MRPIGFKLSTMRFDLVIFDCDGVLVDSEGIANQVLATILCRHGASLCGEDAQRIFVGQSVDAIRETALRELGVELQANWAAGYYEELLPALREVQAISGVRSVLERLRSIQAPICVASQGPPEKMSTTLEATQLAPFFEGRVYSAKTVRRPKPAPDLFLHAAGACGVEPRRCAVVEDSHVGVMAAVAAGMTVFAYCPPSESALMVARGAQPIHSMKELLPALGC
jgi:HAD superfamily hydrolase (TIGR01509 family)